MQGWRTRPTPAVPVLLRRRAHLRNGLYHVPAGDLDKHAPEKEYVLERRVWDLECCVRFRAIRAVLLAHNDALEGAIGGEWNREAAGTQLGSS